jgi:pyruvate dehydrogenase (quinone)
MTTLLLSRPQFAFFPSFTIGLTALLKGMLLKECNHYCELILGANQMPRFLEVAIRQAVGNRGVSVVVIPGDIALQPTLDAPPSKVGGLLPSQTVVMPTRANVNRLAELLNSDGRVTMLCGSGCQGAHDEVLALADHLQARSAPVNLGVVGDVPDH